MSEGAVSAKPVLLYGLARNRRGPKRPSEPRPSGDYPEEGAVEKDSAAFRFDIGCWLGSNASGFRCGSRTSISSECS